MSKVRIIVNALLVISGAFLCAESGLDSPTSQLDVPIAKKAKKLDRAMLLELAKAMAELKIATSELKEIKAQSAQLRNDLPV